MSEKTTEQKLRKVERGLHAVDGWLTDRVVPDHFRIVKARQIIAELLEEIK